MLAGIGHHAVGDARVRPHGHRSPRSPGPRCRPGSGCPCRSTPSPRPRRWPGRLWGGYGPGCFGAALVQVAEPVFGALVVQEPDRVERFLVLFVDAVPQLGDVLVEDNGCGAPSGRRAAGQDRGGAVLGAGGVGPHHGGVRHSRRPGHPLSAPVRTSATAGVSALPSESRRCTDAAQQPGTTPLPGEGRHAQRSPRRPSGRARERRAGSPLAPWSGRGPGPELREAPDVDRGSRARGRGVRHRHDDRPGPCRKPILELPRRPASRRKPPVDRTRTARLQLTVFKVPRDRRPRGPWDRAVGEVRARR